MSRIGFGGVLFAVVAVLTAGAVQADTATTYADEAGDALDGRASMDIISITHDLRQVNKAGPPSIVFEMELAAPPENQLVSYGINAELEGCGSFDALFRPGAVVYEALEIGAADFYLGCEDEILPAQFRIDGNVLRWAMAIDGLPAKYRSGKLIGLNAFTDIVDPATGEIGTGDTGVLPIDAASTDQTWSF